MIKTIIGIVMILVALNYLLMAGTVLLGKWSGYETTCNPVYCSFKSIDKETHCTRNGIPVNCTELEMMKRYKDKGASEFLSDIVIKILLKEE